MELVLQHRVEIALRSLSGDEQKQVTGALNEISLAAPEVLRTSSKFHKLVAASGENLYVYNGGPGLRLVLSIQGNRCSVEDVVARERLDRLLPPVGQH